MYLIVLFIWPTFALAIGAAVVLALVGVLG
jgi:hypothetical protein